MRYQFLIDTYETEILKVLTLWTECDGADLLRRPHEGDPRGRNFLEHMIHQCVSEDGWFRTMLGIRVTESPLPEREVPEEFRRCYARDSAARLTELTNKDDAWWEELTGFFEVPRSRAWVMTRRIAHTAHHRGQQTALVRMFARDLYSTYGPTADTGGLPANHAATIYAYPDRRSILEGGKKQKLPGAKDLPQTERPR
jgi:uncharacterized damage-inducible protein DinB